MIASRSNSDRLLTVLASAAAALVLAPACVTRDADGAAPPGVALPIGPPSAAASIAPPSAAATAPATAPPVEAPAAAALPQDPGDPCGAQTGDEPPEPGPMAAAVRESVALGDSPRLGPAEAPVTIVFAADLECDYCAQASVTLRQLRELYGDRLAIVFKHHPLPAHLHAVEAAAAVEAAGQQGRFWEMADLLFTQQDHLDRPGLLDAAARLGLDARAFEAALDAPDLRRRVRADRDLMDSLGARGAPTFWINGRRLVGAYPLATFRALLDEELADLGC